MCGQALRTVSACYCLFETVDPLVCGFLVWVSGWTKYGRIGCSISIKLRRLQSTADNSFTSPQLSPSPAPRNRQILRPVGTRISFQPKPGSAESRVKQRRASAPCFPPVFEYIEDDLLEPMPGLGGGSGPFCALGVAFDGNPDLPAITFGDDVNAGLTAGLFGDEPHQQGALFELQSQFTSRGQYVFEFMDVILLLHQTPAFLYCKLIPE